MIFSTDSHTPEYSPVAGLHGVVVHAVHTDSDVAPVAVEYVPAGHVVHADCPMEYE